MNMQPTVGVCKRFDYLFVVIPISYDVFFFFYLHIVLFQRVESILIQIILFLKTHIL